MLHLRFARPLLQRVPVPSKEQEHMQIISRRYFKEHVISSERQDIQPKNVQKAKEAGSPMEPEAGAKDKEISNGKTHERSGKLMDTMFTDTLMGGCQHH